MTLKLTFLILINNFTKQQNWGRSSGYECRFVPGKLPHLTLIIEPLLVEQPWTWEQGHWIAWSFHLVTYCMCNFGKLNFIIWSLSFYLYNGNKATFRLRGHCENKVCTLLWIVPGTVLTMNTSWQGLFSVPWLSHLDYRLNECWHAFHMESFGDQ